MLHFPKYRSGVTISQFLTAMEVKVSNKGVIPVSDNVTITCTVKGADLLKWRKKLDNGQELDITTNQVILGAFEETGRYSANMRHDEATDKVIYDLVITGNMY